MHAQGRIELRSLSQPEVEVLAEDADDLSMYDPVLELIWYTQEARLFVIDLREPDSSPVLIASKIPDVSRIEIQQANRTVRAQEPCEGPTLRLRWTDSPRVEAYDSDVSETRIEGRSWLQAQSARPARAVSETRGFEETTRVPLPGKVLDCAIPELCGTSIDFGAGPLRLVLVMDKSGGDCWNRGCLLVDTTTNRYASPLDRDHWGPATKAKRGPCGLYLFNEQKSAFLVGSRLCIDGGSCTDLDGEALGWLNPGDTLGAMGDPGDDELSY